MSGGGASPGCEREYGAKVDAGGDVNGVQWLQLHRHAHVDGVRREHGGGHDQVAHGYGHAHDALTDEATHRWPSAILPTLSLW